MLEYKKAVQFDPYDDEVINKYLSPKVKGEPYEKFIVMKDVYAKEPWLLDHTRNSNFKKNEWYYFVTRVQVSQKKIGHGKKSKRQITGDNDCGSWKATDVKDYIKDKETNEIIGIKRTLNFINSNNNKKKKQKRGDGASFIVPGSDSSWIMTEYMLPDESRFQELVICKIHKVDKSKKKDDHTYRNHESIPASSTEQHPINIDHRTVPDPSFLEQNKPLLCGGNGNEIPHMGFMCSLSSSAAEIERNIYHSGEGNMVHQIDTFSMIETVPQKSSQKDGNFEAMEVTQKVEEDRIGDLNGQEVVLMTNTEVQRQPPISAPAHMNVFAPARRGVKSLRGELSDDSKGYKEWEASLSVMMRDEEDAPNMPWWEQLII